MNFMIYIFIGLLGLIIGSFLNVVVLRLHTKKISRGRSKCAKCNHTLNTFDLIPFFSFIFLGGRCRYCGSRISIQYPLVELFTALTYVAIYYRVSMLNNLGVEHTVLYFIYYSIIFSLLIALSVYDIRHLILPWKLMKQFLLFAFIGSIVIAFLNLNFSYLNLISGFIVALPFYLIWYFSKGRLIGFGDIMLMCGFGFLLGILGGLSAIIFGFWIGTIFIFLKMLFSSKKLKKETQIPFGPFLVLGFFVAFIFDLTIYKLVLLF